MKRRRLLLPISILFVLALSFTSLVNVQRVDGAGATRETQPVYTTTDGFHPDSPVPGAYATLVRNKEGLTTNVHTSLASGGVYTIWWVIFNHPEDCSSHLCIDDLPDLVVNATGRIVPLGSPANFGAWVGMGGPYSGEIILEGADPSLTNPAGALITLVIRYHGAPIPGMIPEQLSTFEGGCPGGVGCVDEQLVFFPGDCSGACGP
jgi:hypothetical protein